MLARRVAVVLGLHLPPGRLQRHVAALQPPLDADDLGKATLDVDGGLRVGVGPRRIIDRHRRLVRAGMDRDLGEGHADVRPDHARLIDLAPPRSRAGRDGAGRRLHALLGLGQGEVDIGLGGCDVDVHGGLFVQRDHRRGVRALAGEGRVSSLRRHDPDQVRPVRGSPQSQRLRRRPRENGGRLGAAVDGSNYGSRQPSTDSSRPRRGSSSKRRVAVARPCAGR